MKQKYLILFSLSGFLLCFDQFTKHWIQNRLLESEQHSIVSGVLSLTRIQNTRVLFGALENVPESVKEVFFIGIPIFALVLILLIFVKLQGDRLLTSVALTFILSGAIGNLIDRIQFGYVMDFIVLHTPRFFELPPFNIADISIVVGLFLIFINTIQHSVSRGK
jgi:signal peptidase II